jgi:carboxypeptidase Q
MRKLMLLPLFFIAIRLLAQNPAADSAMILKIRQEGLNHSQVMEIAFYLTDANGPRLMQSPGYFRAANWAKARLESWGLQDARLEPWGHWGKGWELNRFYFAMTAPFYKPLIAFPKTWSAGTNGPQNAEVILVDAIDSAALESWHGKLRGKIVITPRKDTLPLGFKPDGLRYTDEELKKMEEFDPKAPAPANPNRVDFRALARFQALVKNFADREGAVAVLTSSVRNSDGTVFVQNGSPYSPETPATLPDLAVSFEDYMTIVRLLQHQVPVRLDLDLKTSFYPDDQQGYNVVGEIKGTDKKLKDQLVMIGGHLDSWQGATGATDNGAGSAVMLEVMRILKAVGFTPRRTIRIALWSGEETGLFGSKNYVKNHFTDTATKKFNAEGDKLSVYFNLDNGTGKIRGVYLQGNEAVRPIFSEWLKPFHDLGATTLTLENTGGTDHLSFDAIGLPAFQFIQDGMEYNTRTHHSNMDTYDHLSEADLKQAATIIAAFVYDAAQREEKMPRKN